MVWGGWNPLMCLANRWNIWRMEICAKCPAQERKERAYGIWRRMWGSSQKKLCLRPVLSYRDREHEEWGLRGSLFLLPESSRARLQQSTVQCGLVSWTWQRHPQGPRQGMAPPSLLPGPCPVLCVPEWPPEMSSGQDLGKVPFSLPAVREK